MPHPVTERDPKAPLGTDSPYLTPKEEDEVTIAAEIVRLGQELRSTAEELCPFREPQKRARWRKAKPIQPSRSVTAPYDDAKEAGVRNRARLIRANVGTDEPIELWVDATGEDGTGVTTPAVKHADINADGTLSLNPALYLHEGPTTLQQQLDAADYLSATVGEIVEENDRVRFVRVPMQAILGTWSGGSLTQQPA